MFEKLGKSLDDLVRTVTTDLGMTRIDPKTDPISIPYPESSPVKLRLEIGVGRLNITPGGAKLAEGSATYNVKEWAPETVVSGGSVTLSQGHGWHVLGGWGEVQNSWDLALGTARAFELNVRRGVGESTLSLGGVPLTDATIETGTGTTTVRFDKPNPENANRVSVKVGAGATKIDGLLNTNAQFVAVDSGAGEIALNFTGENLKRDMNIRVTVGTGKVTINVKAGIPARVAVAKGLGDIRARGAFRSTNYNVYETGNYSTAAGPKLTFEVNAGVGSTILNAADQLDDIFA
jgi:hypothetical protein